MSSSPNPTNPNPDTPPAQSPMEEATVDEDALAMHAPNSEEALIANFDRYLLSEESAPESTNAPTSSTDTNPTTAPLARLIKRYPTYDSDVLRDVLVSCNNDERAAIHLLGDVTASTDRDSQLASNLQNKENTRLTRHRRNDAVVPVGKTVMDHIVSTLREIVVPALRAHFEELVLPDMCDTSANVVYTLRDFLVSALSLPSHNIVVRAAPDGKSIRMNVVNMYLELEVGKWSYESKGFVPVKDSGTARVSIHGLNIALKLEPRWSHGGGTKVAIADCRVNIDGIVRFKSQGAAADWAYNAIALVLKPLVISYIKEAIADTVTKTLAVHLREWAFSRSLEEERVSSQSPTTSTRSPVTAE